MYFAWGGAQAEGGGAFTQRNSSSASLLLCPSHVAQQPPFVRSFVQWCERARSRV